MKEIHAFKSALTKASHETSHMMSAHLQNEAHASGWPSHVASNLHVSYGKDGFQAHIHDSHKSEAMDLEYGTPSQRPTAAVRRSINRTQEADKFLVGRMSKMLGNL
jgi:hypothetical protein